MKNMYEISSQFIRYTNKLVVCENPSRSAFYDTQNSPLTAMPRSKPLKSHFFPILMLSLNFSRSS